MRLFTLCTALLTFVAIGAFGQEQRSDRQDTDPIKCGQSYFTEKLHKQNPDQSVRAQKAREKIEGEKTNSPSTLAKGGEEEYIIPVVFHVIHNNGPENISDAQIMDGLENLNDFYDASLPFLDEVVSEFQDIVADMNVRFMLAKLDPEGNCTNGIVRVQNNATFYGGEVLKEISPAWDRSSYLNIWVTDNIYTPEATGGTTLTYAYEPEEVDGPEGEDIDGIVICNEVLGTIGTGNSSIQTSLAHVVGHYLNLSHTWGPNYVPGQNENCDVDDGVMDTPNCDGVWGGCPLQNTTCGSLDNVQNLMSFTQCGMMFTEGQKDRTHIALNSDIADRNQLWTMENLDETGVLQESSLCSADFFADNVTVCAGETVSFEDFSYSGINSWDWSFEGGDPESAMAQSPQVVYSEPGEYDVMLEVSDGENTISVTKEDYIHVISGTGDPIPFSETFESLSELPEDSWLLGLGNSGSDSWEIMDEGSFSQKSVGIDNYGKPIGTTEQLISDVLSVPENTETLYISYDLAFAGVEAGVVDLLSVKMSPDCGDESWYSMQELTGEDLTTTNPVMGEFVPQTSDEWELKVASASQDFLFTDQVRIMFEFVSGGGNNVYIDNINIGQSLVGQEELNAVEFELFPNPAKDNIQLAFSLDQAERIKISIYDLAGRHVQRISESRMPAGEHRISADIGEIEPGAYLVQFRGENVDGAKKLIVK